MARARATRANPKTPELGWFGVSERCELTQVEFAVPLERNPTLAERYRQLLDQEDRTVLAAGTSDGHRHVTAMIARERLQPMVQESLDVAVHLLHVRVLPQERDDRLVPPGQIP